VAELLTFLAVFLLIASAGLFLLYRQVLLTRLSSVVAPRSDSVEGILYRLLGAGSKATVEKMVDPFQKMLPRSPEEVSVTQKRLMWAGYRKDSHVNILYGAKVLVPLLLATLGTVTGLYHYGGFFVYGISFGLGFLLPDYWLGYRIANRKLQIRLGMPEALDLMVICIEAGMGLEQAVSRVADELRLSQPVIHDELNLVNLEQRAGRPRSEAWKNLAERTDVNSVRSLVSTLIQADHFGTSISKTLRVHSDVLRTERRQEAEEQAAKTTVKLVFPLVFFIFPSLFVVVLGPSMLLMKDAFKQYLLN
jgi:tight adherence protein C